LAARHAVLALVVAGTGGCAGPLSALDPAGPAAGGILQIFVVLMAIAVPSFLVIIGLFALSFKDVPGRRVPVRLFLIGGGLVFPLTALTAVTVYGVWLGERITAAGVTPALRVEAQAQQWRWQFTRPAAAGPVTRADVLDIPAGQPVEVTITSADVIHSFWVPRLGGKMDAIPGSRNRLILRADRPGTYRGVCAEFCGTGHTAMGFSVVAHDAAAWAALEAGRTP
jgi:heme/copper-type cytochrome/quinol oxidase subunit 2